jgi:hypothetical protein
MQAVCHGCGAAKKTPLIPCKACGFVPSGDERATAWLFSLEYLESDELEDAAQRILSGQRADPSSALQYMAKEAMGALPFEPTTDLPLTYGELWALSLANLVLTPLTGLAAWHGLKTDRPHAASQAKRVTLPIALALGLVWIILIGNQLSSSQ